MKPSTSIVQQVNTKLINRRVHVSSSWLEQCLEYLNRAGPWSSDVSKLSDYVYSCFLDFDMHLSKGSNSILPENMESFHHQFLFQKEEVILQIDEAINVSSSLHQQNGNTKDTVPNSTNISRGDSERKGGKLNKLLLTDGHRQVVGIDVHGCFQTFQFGMKVLVRKVFIRHGALVLTGSTTSILGGKLGSISKDTITVEASSNRNIQVVSNVMEAPVDRTPAPETYREVAQTFSNQHNIKRQVDIVNVNSSSGFTENFNNVGKMMKISSDSLETFQVGTNSALDSNNPNLPTRHSSKDLSMEIPERTFSLVDENDVDDCPNPMWDDYLDFNVDQKLDVELNIAMNDFERTRNEHEPEDENYDSNFSPKNVEISKRSDVDRELLFCNPLVGGEEQNKVSIESSSTASVAVIPQTNNIISFIYIDELFNEPSAAWSNMQPSSKRSEKRVIRGVASKLFRFKVFSDETQNKNGLNSFKKDKVAESSPSSLENVEYEVIVEFDDGKSSKKLTALVASNLVIEFINLCNKNNENDTASANTIAFFREFHGIFHFKYLEEYLATEYLSTRGDKSVYDRYNIKVVLTHYASDNELQRLLNTFLG